MIAVLAQRRMLQKRLTENREALAGIKFQDELPTEVGQVLKKSPRLKGDGTFRFKTLGCIPFANNFESVRIARRIYFVDPTVIEVLLIPDPGNLERKLAVAVTVDNKVLGMYQPKKQEKCKSTCLPIPVVFAPWPRFMLAQDPNTTV